MCFIDKVCFVLNYLLFEEPCAKKHKVPSTKACGLLMPDALNIDGKLFNVKSQLCCSS